MQTILEQVKAQKDADYNAYLVKSKMVSGDQWANGAGWIGPTVDKSETSVLSTIQDQFVFTNLLADLISRPVNALTYHHPVFSSQSLDDVLNKDESKDNDESLFSLAQLDAIYYEALYTAFWRGNSLIRAFVPMQATEQLRDSLERTIKPLAFEDMLYTLKLSSPDPLTAGIFKDDDGQEVLAYYYYEVDSGYGDTQTMLEISAVWSNIAPYLDEFPELIDVKIENEDDVIVVIYNATVGLPVYESHAVYPLGGYNLVTEIKFNPVITDSILSQQKLFNMAYTMTGRNAVLGGFLERIITNSQLPGYWEKDGSRLNSYESGATFVPTKFYKGAGATNFLVGVPLQNADGSLNYSNVGVHDTQPVPPDTFLKTMDAAEFRMYKEAKQLHALTSADTALSGESRLRAVDDFRASLSLPKMSYEYALANSFTAFIRLCGHLSTDGDSYLSEIIKAKVEPYFGVEQTSQTKTDNQVVQTQ